MTEMLELYDKDLKAAIRDMLQWETTYMTETNEKVESFSKEREDVRKNQMKIVELKIQ